MENFTDVVKGGSGLVISVDLQSVDLQSVDLQSVDLQS
jgi:hypothetical protein